MKIEQLIKISSSKWEKKRIEEWNKKCKEALNLPPTSYLSNKKRYISLLKKVKKAGFNAKLTSAILQPENENLWQEYRFSMWKKKMSVFHGGIPKWFMERKYFNKLKDYYKNPIKHELIEWKDEKKIKIIIIGDTHTSTKWESLFKKEKPNITIHTGDFIEFDCFGFNIENGRKNKSFQYWINGNHEVVNQIWRMNLDDSYFSRMFEEYKVFKIQKKVFLLTHFFEDPARIIKTVSKRTGKFFDVIKWENDLIKKYKPDFIVSGHTHVAHILKKKEYTLLNPGSAVKEAVRKSEGSEINYPSYIVGYAQNGNFEFLFSKAIGFKKSKKVKTYSNNDE